MGRFVGRRLAIIAATLIVLATTTALAVPDPSAVHCQEMGYRAENGDCVFPDDSRCSTWGFLRGECGRRWSYCERKGGSIENRQENMGSWTASYAVCAFRDGTECGEVEYYRGECGPGACRSWTQAGGCERRDEPVQPPGPEPAPPSFEPRSSFDSSGLGNDITIKVPCNSFKDQPHQRGWVNVDPDGHLLVKLCSKKEYGLDWVQQARVNDGRVVAQFAHEVRKAGFLFKGNEVAMWGFKPGIDGTTDVSFWYGPEKTWTVDLEVRVGSAPPSPPQPPPGPVYLAGADGVTSPVLLPGSRFEPAYPELARNARLEGRVILQALVRADGSVSDAEVLSCSRPNVGFEEQAIAAVRRWRYEPAHKDGRPVAVYFTVVVPFTLNDRAAPPPPPAQIRRTDAREAQYKEGTLYVRHRDEALPGPGMSISDFYVGQKVHVLPGQDLADEYPRPENKELTFDPNNPKIAGMTFTVKSVEPQLRFNEPFPEYMRDKIGNYFPFRVRVEVR